MLLVAFIFVIFNIAIASAGTFQNPIFGNVLTPDPFVYLHTDGYYYYSHSYQGSEIVIFKSSKLSDFRNSVNATVFHTPEGFYNLWAPEIHFMENNFYIYFTMDDGNTMNHRMYVIQAFDNTNPLSNYSEAIRLTPKDEDFYAIDGTVLQHHSGQLYFLWSGSHSLTENFPQKIFITTMSSPSELSGNRILLRGPTYPWESKVNEGPEILKNTKDNRTFVVFSDYCVAEGANANYCLCMMWLEDDMDPLVPSNWNENEDLCPVFWRNDEEDVFGPGHCSFTSSPDYTQSWMAYHAFEIPDDGSWGNRTARIEQIGWTDDNFPIFPRPSSLATQLETPSGEL